MDQAQDEDLRRAIALSLEEARAGTSKSPIWVPDDSDEDEEKQFQQNIEIALRQSKNQSYHGVSQSSALKIAEPPANDPIVASSRTTPSAFLAERAQLERERLSRQKRLRPDLDARSDVDDVREKLPAKRRRLSSSSRSSTDSRTVTHTSGLTHASLPHDPPSLPSSVPLFWKGEFRPVANMFAEPRADGQSTFRLSEVLGDKSELSFAIISSYVLSMSWIYSFFDPEVPVIVVAQPDESGQATIKNILPHWIRTTAFLRNGRGCMHMKFMLLFYKSGRLRVVISTANLIEYDYRDIENAIWLQDIPMRPSPIPHDPKITDDFPTLMQRVLRAVNVRPALLSLRSEHPKIPLHSVDNLRTHWDWSEVRAKLVASTAGRHEGWPNVLLTGHVRLMKVVRDLGLRTGKGKAAKHLTLECQGSSIGTYSTQWMNEFYWSARGESAEDWLDGSKAARAKLPYPDIKITFPSLNTVRGTILGERGGGTMFCRRHQWGAAKFPRELFHDSNSTGGSVLMHTKMIIATFSQATASSSVSNKGKAKRRQSDTDTDTETDDDGDVIVIKDEPVGWAYVGSHNFTPSAWGTISGSGFNPILNIVNYELGVVFPLINEKHVDKVACFRRPPRKYVLGQDVPWMQEESAVLQSS